MDGDSGQLFSRGRIPSGTYEFYVNVYDDVYKKEVTSSVSVEVQAINDDAVRNSASVRFEGKPGLVSFDICQRRVTSSLNFVVFRTNG